MPVEFNCFKLLVLFISAVASGCFGDELPPTYADESDSGPQDTNKNTDSSNNANESDTDSTSCPDMSNVLEATIVTSEHDGYKKTNCLTAGCHVCTNPRVTTAYQCALCHGGNGAVGCAQKSTGNCTLCHTGGLYPETHTAQVASGTQDSQCMTCHPI